MKPTVLFAMLLMVAGRTMAETEPEPLPDFSTCMNREVARFERQLVALENVPDLLPFAVGGTTGAIYCGGVGIVNCDRTGTPIPCQHRLAVKQELLATQVLMSLPEPDSFETEGDLGQTLYPQLYALARGTSAGDDCAGAEPALKAWCRAWQANSRLSVTIHLWELARYLGQAEPAVTAGWADEPPLVRPRARKAAQGQDQ